MAERSKTSTTSTSTQASDRSADLIAPPRSSGVAGAGVATDGPAQVSGEGGGGGEAPGATSAVPSGPRARELFSKFLGLSADKRLGWQAALIGRYNQLFAEGLAVEPLAPARVSDRSLDRAFAEIWPERDWEKYSGKISGTAVVAEGADPAFAEVGAGSGERFVDGGEFAREGVSYWQAVYRACVAEGLDEEAAAAKADAALLDWGREHGPVTVDVGRPLVLDSIDLARLAGRLGLVREDRTEGVPLVEIPPMPKDFEPDRVVLVLRSGGHVVSFDVTKHQGGDLAEIELEEFNDSARFVLWGMRHGLRLPDPLVRKPARSEVCPACGAREHFQDRRLADPEVERLVRDTAS